MIKKRVTEEWFNNKWRPAMAWMYLSVCIFDFIIGSFFYAWFAWYTKDFANFGQWKPLTLEGGGLFHMAMGAVLGVTAWGRTQEKLCGVIPSAIIPTPQPMNQSDNGRQLYEISKYGEIQKQTVRGRPIPKTDQPLI
jgi:hypothetical protein